MHGSQNNVDFMTSLFKSGLGLTVTPDQIATFTTGLSNGSFDRGTAVGILATSQSYLVNDHAFLSAHGLA